MTRKAFDGGTVATTLNGAINASVTTIPVADGSTYPSGPTPFVIAVGRNTANEEKMLVGSRTSNVLTITARGYDGTSATAHSDGATVEHVLDALTIDEANELSNTMTTNGDLITRTAGSPARIALGTTGYPLVAGATAPSYAQLGTAGLVDEAVTSAKIANLTIVDGDISASAAIADTKLATIATANKINVSAIDIDGATDIGGALADADLIIVDDGGAGTNRRSALSRIATWLFAKVSGDITIDGSGAAAIGADKVTAGMIGAGVIGASELATDAVETIKIKDVNVTAGKLAADAVETAKIKDGAVTNAKFSTTAGQLGGAWQSFTPVVSSGTHTGTKVGRYIQVGKTVDFIITLTWASGDNYAGLGVDLPVTAQTNVNGAQFEVTYYDALVAYPGSVLAGTTNLTLTARRASQTYVDSVALSTTVPFTWAATDTIQISGRYEAA